MRVPSPMAQKKPRVSDLTARETPREASCLSTYYVSPIANWAYLSAEAPAVAACSHVSCVRERRQTRCSLFPSTRCLSRAFYRIEPSFIRGIRAIPRLQGSNIWLAHRPRTFGRARCKNERIPFGDRDWTAVRL